MSRAFVEGEERETEWIDEHTLGLVLLPPDQSTLALRKVQVSNPAPGGGTSDIATYKVVPPEVDPVPRLDSVAAGPNVVAGQADRIRLLGSGFVPRSDITVERDGIEVFIGKAEFVSFSETWLYMHRGDLDRGGRYAFRVYNHYASIHPGLSEWRYLDVENPHPRVSEARPSEVTAGAPPPIVTIVGGGFTAVTAARVNGRSRTFVWVNDWIAELWLEEEDVQSPGELDIEVYNPTPGGGTGRANRAITVYADPSGAGGRR